MFKKILASFALAAVLIMPAMAISTPVDAQTSFEGLNSGNLDAVAGGAGVDAGETDLTVLIGNFIRIALSFLGVILLVLVIYAGFLWMTAGGNDDQVTKAKTLIGQAIVGLIIVMAAFAISTFVIQALGEATSINVS